MDLPQAKCHINTNDQGLCWMTETNLILPWLLKLQEREQLHEVALRSPLGSNFVKNGRHTPLTFEVLKTKESSAMQSSGQLLVLDCSLSIERARITTLVPKGRTDRLNAWLLKEYAKQLLSVIQTPGIWDTVWAMFLRRCIWSLAPKQKQRDSDLN